MTEVLDLTDGPGSYQWHYWDSGAFIDIMRGSEVVEHLRIILAVRRYPEGSMRCYCERVSA